MEVTVQTVHPHCASVYQAAKLVAALLRVAGVTAGLAESIGSLPPALYAPPAASGAEPKRNLVHSKAARKPRVAVILSILM